MFGVQKIVNLACGSFYALGAYFGITFLTLAEMHGVPHWLMLPVLIIAGLLLGVIGPPIERLLRSVYGRDESFALLLTFALVLMFQDVFRLFWGANTLAGQRLSRLRHAAPRRFQCSGLQSAGDPRRDSRRRRRRRVPAEDQLRPAAARTAENRRHGRALGVDVRRVYSVVFTVGAVLGTVAGALVVPTAAASLDMAIEFVIEAFAVVVIGGLGSMRGALAGALIVGLIRALAVVIYPEFEVLAIYVIVIAVLLLRPTGLFGTQST